MLRLLRADIPATNHPTPNLPLDSAPHTNLLVKDELPKHMRPAPVLRQPLVELGRDLVQLGQPRPGDRREIVVFVVQSHIVRDPVERAVVAERLRDGDLVVRVAGFGRDLLVDVVLGDEVACRGVQAAGEEGAEQEVEEGVGGEEGVGQQENNGVVEEELDGQVEPVYPGEGHAVDGHGAQGVEEDLEGAEEGFAEDGVEEEGFEGGGQVGVETVDAEGFVVG